jgi:hypothetical protein
MSMRHAKTRSAVTAALVLWGCSCSAQTRPHGQEGDTVKTFYPTVRSGATQGVTYERGIVGLALSLEHVGARVRRPRPGSLNPEAGTLEMWLSPRMPVKQMPDFGPIFSMVADPFLQNLQRSMMLLLANNGTDSHGQIVFAINPTANGTGAFVATPPLDWEVGSWHHISVTWGPGGMAIYADGQEKMANKEPAVAQSVAQVIGIGGHADAGAWSQPCEFLIDELRISSTRRSPEAIAEAIARVRGGRPLEEDGDTLLLEHFDGTPAPPLSIASEFAASIIPEGARPIVHVGVQAITRDRVPLSWELTDLEGAPVASGEVVAEREESDAPAARAVADVALDGIGPGIFNLRMSTDPGSKSGAIGATTVWLGAGPTEALADDASPFGQSGCFARDLGEDVFAAQRQMGVKWSRVSFVWNEIEPVNDHFQWDKYDEIVRLAGKYHVQLVPTLMWEDPIPAWAGTPQIRRGEGLDNKRNLPPRDLDDWRDYVRHVVTRYRGSVRWWIPWNEPNLAKYLGPERDPAKYVELLRACAETIREADPEAKICGMDVALVDLPYCEECFELGALAHCDAVGCHPYRMGVDPDERSVGLNWLIGLSKQRTWLEELQELRALINRYAVGRRVGIWLDEMGQPTEEDFAIPNVAVTEQTAAIYLARMYAEGLGTGVIDKGLWFAFHGYGSFSLVRDDFTLKPEAIAYRMLASAVAGKHGVPERARSDDVHAYRFEANGTGAWVTWTKRDAQDVVLADVPDGARAHDIFARPVRAVIRDGRGTVAAGAMPVIVEW